MNKNLQISDLQGISTLTYKGGNSQVSLGELSTFRPFAAFAELELKHIKCKTVSDEKMNGITRRQKGKSYNNSNVLENTLLKRIDEEMFKHNQPSESSIKEVTGLKPIKWVKGKAIFSPLTTLQLLLCTMADFSYMQFGTTWNVSVQVSLNNGEVIRHSF